MHLLDKIVSVTVITGSILGSVVLIPACSSGSGTTSGGGPGAVSSVDSSKTGGSLTDAEAKQYCEDTQRYSEAQVGEADRKKVGCGIGAQIVSSGAKTDAEAQSTCNQQYTACLERPLPGQGDAGPAPDPCAKAKDDLKDCTATINELNTCAADSAAVFKALVGKDFCAEAKASSPDAGTSGPPSSYKEPASCTALRQKCPNLYRDSEG
jgi:hypothetical protein